MKTEEKVKCPYEKKCGGCKYQGIPYEKQLKEKEKKVRKLLKDYGKPEPILIITGTKSMQLISI